MELIKTKHELDKVKAHFRKNREGFALVPTMGALHEGHLSLIQRAKTDYPNVVISIFVNPTQFDDASDLERYPRQLEKDLERIADIAPGSIVFAPSVALLYPEGPVTKSYELDGLDTVMEGRYREGHFDGVCTVVEALFRLIEPTAAYFGEKDYQQLQIIRHLVKTRSIPVQIVGCPIIREDSGLAMSSRNALLPEASRKMAALVYKTLKTAKVKFGTKSANKVADWVRKKFAQHPAFELEYFQIATADTLQPVKRKLKNKKYRAFIAVYISGIRLIDNIALE